MNGGWNKALNRRDFLKAAGALGGAVGVIRLSGDPTAGLQTHTVHIPLVSKGANPTSLNLISDNLAAFQVAYKDAAFLKIRPGDWLVLDFDKPLRPESANPATVCLYPAAAGAGASIPLDIGVDGAQVQLSPKAPLPEEVSCCLEVGAVQAATGEQMASPVLKTFHPADLTPPALAGPLAAAAEEAGRPGAFRLSFTPQDNLNDLQAVTVYFTTDLEKMLDASSLADADVNYVAYDGPFTNAEPAVRVVDLVAQGVALEDLVTDPSGQQLIQVAAVLEDLAGNPSGVIRADQTVAVWDNYIRVTGDNLAGFQVEYKGEVFYRLTGPIRVDFDRLVDPECLSGVRLIDLTDRDTPLEIAREVQEDAVLIYPATTPQEHLLRLEVDGVQSTWGSLQHSLYVKEFKSADTDRPYLIGNVEVFRDDRTAGVFGLTFTPADATNPVTRAVVYATPNLAKTFDDTTIGDGDVYAFEFKPPFPIQYPQNVDFVAEGYTLSQVIHDPSGVQALKVAIRLEDIAGNWSDYIHYEGEVYIVDEVVAYVNSHLQDDTSISIFSNYNLAEVPDSEIGALVLDNTKGPQLADLLDCSLNELTQYADGDGWEFGGLSPLLSVGLILDMNGSVVTIHIVDSTHTYADSREYPNIDAPAVKELLRRHLIDYVHGHPLDYDLTADTHW